MEIVCTFDNGYAQHTAVMLESLLHFNRNVNIHCITDKLSDTNREKINSLITNRKDSSIEYYFISKDIFNNYPITVHHDHLSLATFYRLLIPDLLALEIEKVLYLDCDIIVNGDLSDFWNIDLTDFALAGVEDKPFNTKDGPQRLSYKEKYSYFNAGVLLLNLNYLRKTSFTKTAFEYLDQYSDRLTHNDQDLLNALLNDQKKLVHSKWNSMEYMFIKDEMDGIMLQQELIEVRQNPAIIHFTGIEKPWYKECKHPYKNLYIKYGDSTAFSPIKLKNLYPGLQKIKYIIKQSGKTILDAFGIRHYKFIKPSN